MSLDTVKALSELDSSDKALFTSDCIFSVILIIF